MVYVPSTSSSFFFLFEELHAINKLYKYPLNEHREDLTHPNHPVCVAAAVQTSLWSHRMRLRSAQNRGPEPWDFQRNVFDIILCPPHAVIEELSCSSRFELRYHGLKGNFCDHTGDYQLMGLQEGGNFFLRPWVTCFTCIYTPERPRWEREGNFENCFRLSECRTR